MTKILIIESNTPELLAQGKSAASYFLKSFQAVEPALTITVACPYAGPLAADIYEDVDGVVYTGSGVEWATDAPDAAPLRSEMERTFQQNRPVWGSCNGLQLAAVVLGGTVGGSPNGFEVGAARNITCTEHGAEHAMMAGREDGFSVPCTHRDEVQELPEGAVLLAGNSHSSVQAMVYEAGGVDFWGTQYHPEMSMADVAGASGRLMQTQEGARLAADLGIGDTDQTAAQRLGTSTAELRVHRRAQELINWLAHVKARCGDPTADAPPSINSI